VPSSDHGVAQLPVRGEAAILDRYDDGLSGIERSTDLACVKVATPGARPAAGDEAAIKEPGEAQGRNAQREAKLLGRLPFQAQMRVFAAPLHWQARAGAWAIRCALCRSRWSTSRFSSSPDTGSCSEFFHSRQHRGMRRPTNWFPDFSTLIRREQPRPGAPLTL
jgi:hypothetical protein